MSKPAEPVADQPRKGWMSRERTALWKLGATVVWTVGIVLLGFVFALSAMMISKPQADMTPEQRQVSERDNAQMGSGLAGTLGIGIPAGIWVILTRPGVRKNE